MANYNMNSHWQTPISDKQYKENFDSIFKKTKKKDENVDKQKAKAKDNDK